jgi:hypothetical protein
MERVATTMRARDRLRYQISEILDISEAGLALKHAIHANIDFWLQQRDKPQIQKRIARRTAWNKPIMTLSKNCEYARLRLGTSFADVGRYLDFLAEPAWPFQYADFTHLLPR